MIPLHEDWSVLTQLFPDGWREYGRLSGAIERLRGFHSEEEVLHTLLLHVGCGWSLRQTVVHAKLTGIAAISDVTLFKRLRQSEPWLRYLCEQLWRDNGVHLDPVLQDMPVRLLDATTVKEPGKTGSQWRIHYSLRLPRLECDHFELTPAQGPNTGEKLGRFVFRPGELILAGAGYSNPPGIAAVAAQQAYVCVRLNPGSTPLGDENGKPFPLLGHLQTLTKAGEVGQWAVTIEHKSGWIGARVCAVRKSEAAIERAHQRIVRKQSRGKICDTPEARELACYVVVLTTLPDAVASAGQVLECYRLRWQIELTFKRLQSIAQMGHLPKLDEGSSRGWLYAKLFVALLTEKLVRVGSAISPWGYYLPEKTGASQSVA
jgi:Transposase DDE domain